MELKPIAERFILHWGWSEEMLRLQPETLMKAMGVGAKISRAVRRKT